MRNLLLLLAFLVPAVACTADPSDDATAEGADAGALPGDTDGDEGPPPECQPRSCESEHYQCGDLNDGCGGTLDCGGCGDDTCLVGECVTLECGDTPANACGGCFELTASVGDPCPCGAVGATCDQFGRLVCDDGSGFSTPAQQPATDDSVDEFTEVVGTLEGGPAGAGISDYDAYEVAVDDTIFGILRPAIEMDYNTQSDFKVCLHYSLDDGALVIPNTFLTCDSGEQSDTKINECCLTFPGGSGTLEMSASMNFDVPNFTDGDGTWRISVEHSFEDGFVDGVCETYTLRYHF